MYPEERPLIHSAFLKSVNGFERKFELKETRFINEIYASLPTLKSLKTSPVEIQQLEKTISVSEPEPKSIGLDPVSSLQTVSERDESSLYSSDFDSDEEIEVVDRGTWTLPKGQFF